MGAVSKALLNTLIMCIVVSRFNCARILLLTPPVNRGSKSHRHLMTHVGETLASNGHDVTMLLQGKCLLYRDQGAIKSPINLVLKFDKISLSTRGYNCFSG